jgi:hypothetical protein
MWSNAQHGFSYNFQTNWYFLEETIYKRLAWDAHLSNFSRNNVSVVHLFHSPPMHYYCYWKSLYTTGFSYVIRSTCINTLKMTHQLNGEIRNPFIIHDIILFFTFNSTYTKCGYPFWMKSEKKISFNWELLVKIILLNLFYNDYVLFLNKVQENGQTYIHIYI